MHQWLYSHIEELADVESGARRIAYFPLLSSQSCLADYGILDTCTSETRLPSLLFHHLLFSLLRKI